MSGPSAGGDGVMLQSVAQGVVRGYVLAAPDRPLLGRLRAGLDVFGNAAAARAHLAEAVDAGRVVVLELREVEAR